MCSEMEKPSKRKTGAIFCVLFFLIGAAQYFGTSYVPLFIHTFEFVDEMTVGVILAVNYVVAAAGQFFWGNLADQSRTKNQVLRIVLMGTFAATWLLILPVHRSLSTLLPCVIILNLFMLVPLTIFDTIVVENNSLCRLPFGTMRSFSSAGSALASFSLFAIGVFTSVTVRPQTGLAVMAVSALLALFPLRKVPKTYGHAYGHGIHRAEQLRVLMKNRRFCLLLFFGLFNFTCTGCYVSYFSIFFTSADGLGGTLDQLNLYGFLCIAMEAALVVICSRIFRKKNIYWVFTWVSVMGACRALVPFLAPNPYFVMLGGIFQGLTFGPLWGRVAPHIGSIVEDEVRATGQAVWSIVMQGIGPAVGSLLGGAAASALGLRGVFGIVACMHLLTALLFQLPFGIQRRADRKELETNTPKSNLRLER